MIDDRRAFYGVPHVEGQMFRETSALRKEVHDKRRGGRRTRAKASTFVTIMF